MSENVELSSLDLRYEGHRLRDPAREAACWRRLSSGASKNRWKAWTRPRPVSCQRLQTLPRRQEAGHRLRALRVAGRGGGDGHPQSDAGFHGQGVGDSEQARFLVDLLSIHGMSVAEVAQTLSRSKGWISMRRGLLEEMGPAVQQVLFRGAFPVYSYMYTLRPFMRMNEVGRSRWNGSSRPSPVGG